jgi:CxxC motif-containing protein (DUF1111 family)
MEIRRQLCTVIVGSMWLVACTDPTRSPTGPPQFAEGEEEEEVEFGPLRGLTGEQRAQFFAGRVVFDRVFVQEDGLGPIFNASACAECHEDPGSGGPGDEVEIHFSNFSGTTCDLLVAHGGNVLQDSATALLTFYTHYTKEPAPNVTFQTGRRTTPDVLGFGLFENIPRATIVALADPNDANGDGISGRAHITADGSLGRFGRKAGDPSLDRFNAGAFLQEMGITNPENPEELNIGGHVIGEDIDPAVDPVAEPELTAGELTALNAFMRFLAPPKKLPLSNQAKAGKDVFKNIGCIGCHIETMTTGPSSVAALDRQPVNPFTDFLLHDIGTGGASDNCQGAATPAEFRTEPLTGLRFSEEEVGFLHDGSATTIEAAILRHGNEANTARLKFNALTGGQKNALLAYLRSI